MSLSDYETVIGLEVHCQLKTATKMFSSCGFHFGAEPNSLTDAYTWGLPGTLPVANGPAVRSAIAMGLAANCDVQTFSRFARKHYFYPDLPKGYQITQSDQPYAVGGHIEIPASEGEPKRVRLVRIHMEEDAGKNVHVQGEEVSLVDYNRAGAPLLEIVSEPDIRSASDAANYLRELRTIVRYLGISEANMEEGTLRCDANVSIRRRGDETLGTRCEIKNLNSFRFLELAINAEIRRQVDLVEGGGKVIQSTMSYDTARDETRVMRTKEEAADYRYFPDPDLPPLVIAPETIEEVRSSMPELPAARRVRYRELGLSSDDANLLAGDPDMGVFFDRMVEAGAPAKKACNWLTVELVGRLNGDDKSLSESPLDPAALSELVSLVEDGTISGRAAKEVFGKAYDEGASPRAIVERDGYKQVSDAGALEGIVAAVLEANPKQVEQYGAGKTKVRGFFVGQIMKQTKGQANPKVVNELLDKLLPKPQS